MNSPTKLWYLENLHVLHTLSGPEKQHLHEQTRMQTFARGETIFFAGDPADFQALLTADHQFTLEINKLVGHRLQKVLHRLSALVFKTAEERIRDLLRELGQAPAAAWPTPPTRW